MGESEDLGLKLAITGHEGLHGLKRAFAASDEFLSFGAKCGLGFGVKSILLVISFLHISSNCSSGCPTRRAARRAGVADGPLITIISFSVSIGRPLGWTNELCDCLQSCSLAGVIIESTAF